MQPRRQPLPDRLGLARQQAQPGVDAVGRRMQLGIEHDVAALDASLEMPSPARLSAQRSPACPRSAGLFCACSERTRAARPDGLTTTRSPTCTAPDSTVPVTTTPTPGSVKTRSTARRKRASLERSASIIRRRFQPLAQPIDALAGPRRDREDFGALQLRSGDRLADLRDHLGDALGRGEVGLGQRHNAALDAEQVDDRQMFARLRHDAVIGGDRQQREIDAAGAGQHGVDEAFVAGHVDEAERLWPATGR